MAYSDPYYQLGLKRNPFIAPEKPGVNPSQWIDFGYSAAPEARQCLFVQIIGVKGAGKTSHLLHWQQQTGGEYFYQAPFDWRSHPPIGPIVYWDEADRVPLPRLVVALWQARRQNATVVVGTHTSLKRLAQIASFQVRTINLSTLNANSLQKWIYVQLASEALPNQEIQVALSPHEINAIVAQSNGSWRTAACYLHRWFAKQASGQQTQQQTN